MGKTVFVETYAVHLCYIKYLKKMKSTAFDIYPNLSVVLYKMFQFRFKKIKYKSFEVNFKKANSYKNFESELLLRSYKFSKKREDSFQLFYEKRFTTSKRLFG